MAPSTRSHTHAQEQSGEQLKQKRRYSPREVISSGEPITKGRVLRSQVSSGHNSSLSATMSGRELRGLRRENAKAVEALENSREESTDTDTAEGENEEVENDLTYTRESTTGSSTSAFERQQRGNSIATMVAGSPRHAGNTYATPEPIQRETSPTGDVDAEARYPPTEAESIAEIISRSKKGKSPAGTYDKLDDLDEELLNLAQGSRAPTIVDISSEEENCENCIDHVETLRTHENAVRKGSYQSILPRPSANTVGYDTAKSTASIVRRDQRCYSDYKHPHDWVTSHGRFFGIHGAETQEFQLFMNGISGWSCWNCGSKVGRYPNGSLRDKYDWVMSEEYKEVMARYSTYGTHMCENTNCQINRGNFLKEMSHQGYLKTVNCSNPFGCTSTIVIVTGNKDPYGAGFTVVQEGNPSSTWYHCCEPCRAPTLLGLVDAEFRNKSRLNIASQLQSQSSSRREDRNGAFIGQPSTSRATSISGISSTGSLGISGLAVTSNTSTQDDRSSLRPPQGPRGRANSNGWTAINNQ
ncbi:uncharacterized protein L201_006485 [Kwoniella dendrophila CBS 6074]|uniref:Zinc-binding domain-containing protein n=1 Tax=Kwoniella dendrophila CBS 6074 TaxID=1295534 RepID=A0AAX4K355_9TREE